MLILGLTKTTLLDFPEHVAAALFTGGCNFRCPYCHNRDIVLKTDAAAPLAEEDIFSFLDKRRNVLEGVCITGGEPTLHDDLPDFIGRVKKLGYLVKLDTNGTNPDMLDSLICDGLIDYCAMDIKNAPQKYAATVGFPDAADSFLLSDINQSVHTLLNQQKIPYEFRTTVVRELHSGEDMVSIAKWIAGARAYFLQSYVDSAGVLLPGYHAHSEEALHSFADLCRPLVPSVALRGC